MTLRLLVDLYHAQDLREDGGVSRGVTHQTFERVHVGQCGRFLVWGFKHHTTTVCWGPVTGCHKREALSREEKKAGENPGVDFFRRQHQLLDLGVIEWIPTLFESDAKEAEILHPYGMHGSGSLEDRLGEAAHRAGLALLTEGQREWVTDKGLRLVPVDRHMANVQMIGLARLRYRPHTRKTVAWWADLNQKGPQILERYLQIAGDETQDSQAANM